MTLVAIDLIVLGEQQARWTLLQNFAAGWAAADLAGSAGSRNQWAFAEGAHGRAGHNSEAKIPGPVADTTPVEGHHRAFLGSPGLEGNREVQIAGWAAEVHRDYSMEETANAEESVMAVVGAVGPGRAVGLALSVLG